MIEQVNGFITPMKGWDAVEKNDKKITGTENGTKSGVGLLSHIHDP